MRDTSSGKLQEYEARVVRIVTTKVRVKGRSARLVKEHLDQILPEDLQHLGEIDSDIVKVVEIKLLREE